MSRQEVGREGEHSFWSHVNNNNKKENKLNKCYEWQTLISTISGLCQVSQSLKSWRKAPDIKVNNCFQMLFRLPPPLYVVTQNSLDNSDMEEITHMHVSTAWFSPSTQSVQILTRQFHKWKDYHKRKPLLKTHTLFSNAFSLFYRLLFFLNLRPVTEHYTDTDKTHQLLSESHLSSPKWQPRSPWDIHLKSYRIPRKGAGQQKPWKRELSFHLVSLPDKAVNNMNHLILL